MKIKRVIYLSAAATGAALILASPLRAQSPVDPPLQTRYKDFQLYGSPLNDPSANTPADSSSVGAINANVVAVPEPAALSLFLTGLAGLGFFLFRRGHSN